MSKFDLSAIVPASGVLNVMNLYDQIFQGLPELSDAKMQEFYDRIEHLAYDFDLRLVDDDGTASSAKESYAYRFAKKNNRTSPDWRGYRVKFVKFSDGFPDDNGSELNKKARSHLGQEGIASSVYDKSLEAKTTHDHNMGYIVRFDDGFEYQLMPSELKVIKRTRS